jgi:hypothetical protein
VSKISCVDLFCGVGGLTHGFVLEGLPVMAGIAKKAQLELESKTGKKVVSAENYLPPAKKKLGTR